MGGCHQHYDYITPAMASNANPLPVPPRPQQLYDDLPPPPPVPPLPPNYQPERPPDPYVSPPHLEDPLVAPRPQKITPDLPADVRLWSLRCTRRLTA